MSSKDISLEHTRDQQDQFARLRNGLCHYVAAFYTCDQRNRLHLHHALIARDAFVISGALLLHIDIAGRAIELHDESNSGRLQTCTTSFKVLLLPCSSA